jgi:hypothetical protein
LGRSRAQSLDPYHKARWGRCIARCSRLLPNDLRLVWTLGRLYPTNLVTEQSRANGVQIITIRAASPVRNYPRCVARSHEPQAVRLWLGTRTSPPPIRLRKLNSRRGATVHNRAANRLPQHRIRRGRPQRTKAGLRNRDRPAQTRRRIRGLLDGWSGRRGRDEIVLQDPPAHRLIGALPLLCLQPPASHHPPSARHLRRTATTLTDLTNPDVTPECEVRHTFCICGCLVGPRPLGPGSVASPEWPNLLLLTYWVWLSQWLPSGDVQAGGDAR